ncbi:MAG: zinc-ribbon domain-containing protein [Promethearchaeota archaeon]|nr:MAG: zinc-ribbon domain-containing protein [Candidatus Lokiarchaeota archaeon]
MINKYNLLAIFMFCHNCGQKLDDNAIYCEQCGVKVKKENATKWISQSELLNRYHELEYELEDINNEIDTLTSKKVYLNRLIQSRDQKYRQLQMVQNVMLKEKKDYDSLLKVSFSSIKARLSGDLDDRKRKEEIEYFEALANFEYVEKEYKNLESEIEVAQTEIERIQALKLRLPAIENEMEKILSQLTAGKTTDRLKNLEQRYMQIQKEITKAQDIEYKFKQADSLLIEAGNYLNRSVSKLRSAEGLGTWDTFFGGGFFVDGMKHGNLDEARHDINQAQAIVRRAKDLVDVIDDIYIDFEAPNLFFDMFFDNFFFDMFGNTKITRTRQRVEDALYQLNNSRNTLTNYLNQWHQKRIKLIADINIVRKQIREERLSLL